ncbi:MAG: RluA family pseudouridine synthase [Balneolia bacterium]|nr:RluA family pseudouridine synthase [Balneolia bacterium]
MSSRSGKSVVRPSPADLLQPGSCPVRIVAPYAYTYTFRVKQPETGMPLLKFLLKRFPFRSADAWTRRIADGRILRNENAAFPDTLLREGDLISHHNPAVTEPSVPDSVEILQKTSDFLVAYKPAPMPVHAGGRYQKNTLIEILGEMTEGPLHIIHRLDSVTSGLMLIGRNPEFSHKASLAFKQGDVEKNYFALCDGVPEDDGFTCDFGIRREKGYRFTCADDGKQAFTRFHTIKRGTKRSVISCEPVTGRTHQLRLHLSALGFPIWDDEVYKPEGSALLQNSGISLQSSTLRIPELDVNCSIDVPSEWHENL